MKKSGAKKSKKKLSIWRNVKVGWKYGLTLFLCIIIFTCSMGFIFSSVRNTEQDINTMEQVGDETLQVTEAIILLNEVDIQAYDYMISKSDEKIKGFRDKIKELEELLSGFNLSEDQSSEIGSIIGTIKGNIKNTSEIFENELCRAVKRNLQQDSVLTRRKMTGYNDNNMELLKQIQNLLKEKRTGVINNSQKNLSQTILVLIVSLIISIILGSFITFLVSRVIEKQMNNVIKLSDEIANGNLSIEKIDYIGKDEIGQLAQSVNKMSENLRDIIKKISIISDKSMMQSLKLIQSSSKVKIGSTEIARTMEQLSAGTEEQASSSSEIAIIIKTLNERIIEANDENNKLTVLSQGFTEMSTRGNELMEDFMLKMEQINTIVRSSVDKVKSLDQKSKEISKLVEVIDNIADQTNLLALNAAIEAARAGESGKGFAVVADEIRKLAEQVAKSIINITDIVKGIQNESKIVADSLEAGYEQVEEGSKQAKVTRDTFCTINNEVSKVNDGIRKIGDNLNEVANSSKEINTSVENIAAISEETAAEVEQTSESIHQQDDSIEIIVENAEQMSKLAEELKSMISSFKL